MVHTLLRNWNDVRNSSHLVTTTIQLAVDYRGGIIELLDLLSYSSLVVETEKRHHYRLLRSAEAAY